MPEISADEARIVTQYRLWENWTTHHWDYKYAKGARIADIIEQSGGMPSLAVELGVGPGGVATTVSRRGTKVIGLDLSPQALKRAQHQCRAERVSLMMASGFALPFSDASIDLLYASQVLHLFETPGRLSIMKEAFRVLKPGGRFVFDLKNVLSHPLRYLGYNEQRRRMNFPSTKEIRTLLNEARFSLASLEPGVFPVLASMRVPNVAPLRALAHTRFFVAVKPVR